MSKAKLSKKDRVARDELVKWFLDYAWNRGGLPPVGVSSFSVPGLGVPVQVTRTGQCIAYFSSYEVACSAVSEGDRAIRNMSRPA